LSFRLLNYFPPPPPPGENYSWAISILAEILTAPVSLSPCFLFVFPPCSSSLSLTNVASYVIPLAPRETLPPSLSLFFVSRSRSQDSLHVPEKREIPMPGVISESAAESSSVRRDLVYSIFKHAAPVWSERPADEEPPRIHPMYVRPLSTSRRSR